MNLELETDHRVLRIWNLLGKNLVSLYLPFEIVSNGEILKASSGES